MDAPQRQLPSGPEVIEMIKRALAELDQPSEEDLDRSLPLKRKLDALEALGNPMRAKAVVSRQVERARIASISTGSWDQYLVALRGWVRYADIVSCPHFPIQPDEWASYVSLHRNAQTATSATSAIEKIQRFLGIKDTVRSKALNDVFASHRREQVRKRRMDAIDGPLLDKIVEDRRAILS
ncbi:hypothetical protein DIPPA_14214, partial [Diplonema papillatum]